MHFQLLVYGFLAKQKAQMFSKEVAHYEMAWSDHYLGAKRCRSPLLGGVAIDHQQISHRGWQMDHFHLFERFLSA